MEKHEHIQDVLSRLSKIEGHIRGIMKMLNEDQPCDLVLLQFSAVKSALSKASKILLEDHFEHCIMSKAKNKALRNELIEFKMTFDKFMA